MLKPVATSIRTCKHLNGDWGCAIDTPTQTVDVTQPLTANWHLPVPGAFNDASSPAELQRYDGILVFETTFEVTRAEKEKRLVLHFESVVHHCQIFVNGRQAMENRGGYLPFEAAVNDLVQPGTNRLTVRLTNLLDVGTLPPGSFSPDLDAWSGFRNERFFNHADVAGILGNVMLYTTPWFYIDHIAYACHITESDAALSVDVSTVGPYDKVNLQVFDDYGRMVACGDAVNQPLRIREPECWALGAPSMYRLMVETLSSGVVIDSYELLIALRHVETRTEGWYLNQALLAEPIHVWPVDAVRPPYCPGAAEELADWVQSQSCRMIWTGDVPVLPAVLETADDLGIGLITGVDHGLQAPVPDDVPQEEVAAYRADAHRIMVHRMMNRDGGHPSVLGWFLGRHLEGAATYLAEMAADMRHRDGSHRPFAVSVLLDEKATPRGEVVRIVPGETDNLWHLARSE